MSRRERWAKEKVGRTLLVVFSSESLISQMKKKHTNARASKVKTPEVHSRVAGKTTSLFQSLLDMPDVWNFVIKNSVEFS